MLQNVITRIGLVYFKQECRWPNMKHHNEQNTFSWNIVFGLKHSGLILLRHPQTK